MEGNTTVSSETATAAVSSAAKKAAHTTATIVTDTLPTVLETAEVGVELPTVVALPQSLVVTISVVAGVAIGVGGLYGFNRWRNRNKIVVAVSKDVEDETVVSE